MPKDKPTEKKAVPDYAEVIQQTAADLIKERKARPVPQ